MSFCAYKLKNKSTSIKRAYRLSVRLCRTPLPQEVDSSPLCSFSFSAVPTEKEKTGVFLQKFAKKNGLPPKLDKENFASDGLCALLCEGFKRLRLLTL